MVRHLIRHSKVETENPLTSIHDLGLKNVNLRLEGDRSVWLAEDLYNRDI
jgi:hypothetical protein